MIIRSLRLKNIRSYGEGPDGNGVTIRFEPGVNRIAGKNGHGKSTLIESLGYALFLTRPVYEEQFDAATYLLRTGKKAGEIEVEFHWEGREYRLERGLGTQNKRRAKVILADDGSTEAEGDEAVTDYLCRLFRFRSAERFSELFAKLLGVKQGRLAWPFDSKREEARRHFEPLLDVEIFRQCFDGLRPVLARFDELKHGREKEMAAAEERIRERADSPARVQVRREEVAALGARVAAARKEQADAEQEKTSQEEQERAYQAARGALDASTQQAAAAAQRRETALLQVREAGQAVETAAAAQPAFEIYTRAERELRRLQGEQAEKGRLEKQRGQAERLKVEWDGKVAAARQHAAGYEQQIAARTHEARELVGLLSAGRAQLQQGALDFERLAERTETARRSREALQHWLSNLARDTQTNAAQLATLLADGQTVAAWDGPALLRAREDDEKADRAAREIALKLAETRKFNQTLGEQLGQIRGGVCPFLKEQCRQFDPAKIQSDIAAVEKEIERLTAEHERAAEKHRASRTLVEKLARQETAVAQRRKTIEHNIAAMVARHNQLFPAVARDQFGALLSCLDGAQASVTLPVLVPIDASAWSADSSEAAPVETARGWIDAETAFREQAARVFEQVSTVLADKFRAFEAQRDDRLRAERDLANQQRNLDKLELESAQLKEQLRQTSAQADEGQRESAKAEKALADLEASLKPFAELNQQITAQQLLKDENAERYGRYLGAKPTADKLAERRSAFEQANAAETRAKEDLTRRTQAFEAVRSFDPAKLIAARRRAGDAEIKLAGESLHLQNAERELTREQARLGEWELALAAKQELLAAHARVEACLALTQMGRRILQKAAPLVAQHVCGRVAAKAQQIFNQLSDEPVELEWSAERYGLRISPGDRRFAMLSGGEQTKLAVAMTLAMLQEFSDLKFCIFDEPTYGVDAESRQKLAEAILKVPGVSDNILDQLLVVSHDDAFEGKAGNVIVIRKTAAEGSLAGAPG